MKKMISRLLVFAMIIAVCTPFSAVFAAETKIVLAGSTSVQPLAEELAAAYMQKNKDIKIEVQGGGSSVGVKSAADGIADIGMSSRELTTSEKGLHEFEIALDGIAVVVNPSNKTSDLTMDQVKKIFVGEITNWKEVGGADKPIVVVSREQGSGTRGAFIEITGIQGKDASGKTVDNTTNKAITQPSTGAVKQTVAVTPESIGYVSLGAMDTTVKALKIAGVEATEANIKAKKYGIYRPFLLLTKSAPSGAVKQFIDFILSAEGQKIVGKDYITVKEASQIEAPKSQAPTEVTVMVNGKKVAFDAKPMNDNGRVLVPVRAILEALGVKLDWDAKAQTVTATKSNSKVVLTIGKTTATKDGKSIQLDVPAKIVTGGRTVVPVRFISEAFGANVDWNAATQTITITQ
ncbi:phosphate ABC transporter substrate-binding protein PstS family protein [Geosporobacter ferrireducens]|uniref:phosphate ABC transporter substrate-binding protein PstS family protein n=1 Tax=Geosporobacter ferrireducens TaxID=1424294 RepID=UPI00139CC083|nr:phosphate ABC transporter substrate-binding protein PstS family protein [Geosporobacter ferrireducens]MTI55779.1 phosphate ABC transporter substrate-binding protein PstS family protein [Geosporobacter ferrireducens]